MKSNFKVSGMTCGSCVEILKDIARDFAEITKCEVELKSGDGFIEYTQGFEREKFKKEVEGVGKYRVEFRDKE